MSAKPERRANVIIDSYTHDGRGLTTEPNGKKTFVMGALPGETVSVTYIKRHARYNEADVDEIFVASADRVPPPCKHFMICGGCSMQHLEMNKQVEFKQKALLEQLKHFGKVIPENILPPLTKSPLGYRRKARLGVRYSAKKQKIIIGFRERSSQNLTDVEHCPVLHKSIGDKFADLAKLILGLTIFDQIPQIEVAIGDDQTALVFRHLKPMTSPDIESLKSFAKLHTCEIYLQPNAPQPLIKIWPEDNHYRLSYTLPAFDLQMHFHPLDFTQINSEINEVMIQQALQLLDISKNDTILDLFCGLGNFTLPMARLAAKVIGIEGSMEMVQRARENSQLNDIHNTEFHMENLALENIDSSWSKQKFSKVLLDPPRTGAKEIMPLLMKMKPKKILYISCNPATFARDAGVMVNNHYYRLTTLGVMNMFPHTSHIEAMGLFERK